MPAQRRDAPEPCGAAIGDQEPGHRHRWPGGAQSGRAALVAPPGGAVGRGPEVLRHHPRRLLAATDPAIIGAVVDGIILTVRAWKLDRHDAERSLELLQSLGTPILGLLVNGIHPGEGDYSARYRYDGNRSDPASRLTRGEDPPPTIAARSQPQANGHTESDSHESHVVCAAVNNVPVPDEWSARISLSRGADLPAPPS